jgi:hypothetical protein
MLVNNGLIISLMQIVKYIINVNLSCLGFYCSQNFTLKIERLENQLLKLVWVLKQKSLNMIESGEP